MLRIPVTYDLICEVKQDMEYCMNNPYHCCVIRNGEIVGIVFLDTLFIQKGADLLSWEIEEVKSVVKKHRYDLEEEYRRILSGW